ncbi:hypothetical protein [Dactylosporangium sp. NPDC051541]|uniref:hypothetical protein n=1 Tax=Dactylosporangium sp. NPDC051541 TaxID=3363977 RepID=UPI0037B71A45
MGNRIWSIALVGLLLAGCSGPEKASPATARKEPAASPSPSEGPLADDYVGVLNDHYVADLGSSGAPKGTAFDPNVASVRGPHYAVALAESVTVPELPAVVTTRLTSENGSRSTLRPNPGHEILLARFTKPPKSALDKGSAGTLEVVVGDQRRPLAEPVTDGTLLAVSVPAGAPVSLQLTEDGRAQSIDLRTGSAGRVAGLYPIYVGRADTMGSWITPAGSDMIPLGIGVDFELTPWVEGSGWAPAGQAWLWYEVSGVLYGDGVDCAIDMGRTFSLSGSGLKANGAGTFTVPSFAPSTTSSAPTQDGVVAAPANLRSVTVGWSLHASCTKGGAPVKFSIRSNEGKSATFKPES